MAILPEEFYDAWNDMQAAAVLTTVDEAGMPNSVWIHDMKILSDEKIGIADNYLDKTRTNIKKGSKGSFLIIDSKKNNYQLKGSFEYCCEGPYYDDMKRWNRRDLPGVAVVVFHVEEVWSGANRLA